MFAIGSIIVLTTIQFDDELYRVTGEIRNIRTDRRLSAEVEAMTLKFPKITPKQVFCICGFAS